MDLFISFQSEDEEHLFGHLVKKLENFYTTHISLEEKQLNEEENKKIKESKLFMALLTPSFLNSPKCMMQLKFALKNDKKILLLENERFKIPLETIEEFKLNNLNCVTITFRDNVASDHERIFNIIEYFLK